MNGINSKDDRSDANKKRRDYKNIIEVEVRKTAQERNIQWSKIKKLCEVQKAMELTNQVNFTVFTNLNPKINTILQVKPSVTFSDRLN